MAPPDPAGGDDAEPDPDSSQAAAEPDRTGPPANRRDATGGRRANHGDRGSAPGGRRAGDPTWWQPGIGTCVGFAAAVAASFTAAAAGGARTPGIATAVFAAATLLVALRFRPVDGLATAALCWMFQNAFLVNRAGELSWHGPPDAARVAVLAATVPVGLAARSAHRYLRVRARRRPPCPPATAN